MLKTFTLGCFFGVLPSLGENKTINIPGKAQSYMSLLRNSMCLKKGGAHWPMLFPVIRDYYWGDGLKTCIAMILPEIGFDC